jgi:hypothetical protein
LRSVLQRSSQGSWRTEMADRAAQAKWQAAEEARHAGAASLTAVRIWPLVAPANTDDAARKRFIRIITAYKILDYNEAIAPMRKQEKILRKIIREIKNNNLVSLQSSLTEMTKDPASKSILVRLQILLPHRLRDGGQVDPDDVLVALVKQIRRLVAVESRQRGRGHPSRAARRRLTILLIAWWDRHVRSKAGHALLPSGEFQSPFIDFVCAVNDGLRGEINRTNVDERVARRRGVAPIPAARWLSTTLPLGNSRATVIAALALAKDKK